MSANKQKLVILFSGKRKTGRDFLSAVLLSKLGESVAEMVCISEPVKRRWAVKMALNTDELLGCGPLKQQNRKEMICWSEKVREQLPTFFCKEAFRSATKPVAIVSDIRHQTDMDYFTNLNIPFIAVRIDAGDRERENRGWVFTKGIDDVVSECNLDDFNEWDFVIDSDNDENAEIIFQNIKSCVEYILKK